MDYEKKYKEALEWARKVIQGKVVFVLDEVLEKFPELKESKDEKIRRVISGWIYTQPNSFFDNGISKEEMLAWLEKQDKPIDKIVKRAMTEKQRVLLTETNGDTNIDWDTRSLQDVKLLLEHGLDYIKKLEKQGEANDIEKEINWLKSLKTKYNLKVEWSEDDEANLNEALSYIKNNV